MPEWHGLAFGAAGGLFWPRMDDERTPTTLIRAGEGVPAVVAAGDRRASKRIYGESKVYLEVGGRPLVAHVVAASA